MKNALAMLTFTCTFMLINNSVPATDRGTVNGLGMTLGSIGKGIGPAIGAPLFAWSASNGLGYPFDYHLVFTLAALTCVLSAGIAFRLPFSLERPFSEIHGS